MSFGTSSIDAGSNPTLPVAVDTVSGALHQRVKLSDPTADQSAAIGVDGNPLRVRSRRRGTADYDSGDVSVTNGAPASVTSATVYLLGAFLTNTTDQIINVTLTDTAGAAILSSFPLQPRDIKALPLTDELALVGVKVGADAAGVRFRAWGTQ